MRTPILLVAAMLAACSGAPHEPPDATTGDASTSTGAAECPAVDDVQAAACAIRECAGEPADWPAANGCADDLRADGCDVAASAISLAVDASVSLACE